MIFIKTVDIICTRTAIYENVANTRDSQEMSFTAYFSYCCLLLAVILYSNLLNYLLLHNTKTRLTSDIKLKLISAIDNVSMALIKY